MPKLKAGRRPRTGKLLALNYGPENDRSRAMLRCIERAADATGCNEFHVATIMTYFLEELCQQVALGRAVTIPGFGAFGPLKWQSRKDPEKLPHCYPGFSAAIPFRNAVRFGCSPAMTDVDWIRKHSDKHNSYTNGRAPCDDRFDPAAGRRGPRQSRDIRRPDTAFRSVRQRIAVRAREVGMSV